VLLLFGDVAEIGYFRSATWDPFARSRTGEERFQFVRDARRRLMSFTELCAMYGIVRFS